MTAPFRQARKRRLSLCGNKAQQGFSLIEVMIVVVMLGILTIVLAPTMQSIIGLNKRTYNELQRLNNMFIGSALMQFAATTPAGRLPIPFSSGAQKNTVFDPTDSSPDGLLLSAALVQTGINMAQVNDDGGITPRLRVYQAVSPPPTIVPLYMQSGPLVSLNYDIGTIYLTGCSKGESSCIPSTGNVPGASAALTSSNYTSWDTTEPDSKPYLFSSLPIQKQMLATTAQRLDRVRDSLLSLYRSNQLTASASDQTNWYPNQEGLAEPGNRVNSNPLGNSGCRDGWYRLDDPASMILATAGLSILEYGQTTWGGAIEYCRDFDPTAVKDLDMPPHYAALRIHHDASKGMVPDPAIPGNNVIVTF